MFESSQHIKSHKVKDLKKNEWMATVSTFKAVDLKRFYLTSKKWTPERLRGYLL
jgi:hypothetical protein